MVDIFQLIISDDIQENVVRFTNKYAGLVYEAHNEVNSSGLVWKPLDKVELLALIGLLLRAGIERNYDQKYSEFWSKDLQKRRIVFVATMTRKRFVQLTSFLRFDDVEVRRPGLKNWLKSKIARQGTSRNQGLESGHLPHTQPQNRTSKLDAIRLVFDPFVGNIQSLYDPGSNITVDEMLLRFKGKCPFRVYMPKKPGRYGIKIWIAADSSSGYVLNLQIYEGKLGGSPEKELGKRVMLELLELYENTHRGVTGDNFFTSLALTNELFSRGLTYVGTIRKSRREIPREFAKSKGKIVGSSHFLFQENTTLVNFVAKKSKPVLLLSTQHNDAEVSDDLGKPEIILHYNRTKG